MTKRLSRVFRFAEPIVHGSLIRQILVALVLGAALAFVWPTAAKDVGILGEIFVTALKGVAPVLVFVLVTSAIANSSMSTEMHIRPVIALYLASTFGAAMASVAVSFMFPTTITLTGAAQSSAAPGEISQVLTQLLLNVVDNPVRAIANANYIGILAWAVAVGMILRKSREETRIVLGDASSAVSSIVQIVIRFAPIGIFGLVSHTLATEGFQVMLEFAQLLLVLLGAMAFVALVLNPFIVWVATHDNPYPLTFMVLRESGVSAFFTRSSAANIPVNMDICRRLKLPESTYAISIPVGSTINMAGHDHGDHALGRALARHPGRHVLGDLPLRHRERLRRGHLGRSRRLAHADPARLRPLRHRPGHRHAGRGRGLHHQRPAGLDRNWPQLLLRRPLHDRRLLPRRPHQGRTGGREKQLRQ